MKLYYTGIEDGDVEKIHETSVKILSEIGVVFHSKEAVEICKKAGAKVNEEIVYFSEKQIDEALKTTPSQCDLYGIQDKICIGDKITKNIPAYGPIYILKEGQYSKASHEHLVDITKLNETSDVMDLSNPNIIDVSYIKGDDREKYRLGVGLTYSKKPLMGLVEGKTIALESLKLIKRFYGLSADSERNIALGLIDTMGPMRLSTSMAEALIEYAKDGQSLMICSGQTLGITAPQSMAGTFTMGNAMILASIVLSQIVRPGTPVIYAGKFDSADMRLSSAAAYGGIESLWSAATSAKMAEFYSLPLQTGAANTDSKVLDYQSGAETFMNLFSAYALNADCILHAAGILDSFNSFSYEKFMLDEERIKAFKHMKKGYQVTDDTLMYDSMLKTGPAGQHFERTKASYRKDFFMPKFSIRDNHNNWMQSGCTTGENIALTAFKERIQNYEYPEFNEDQKKIIKSLLPEDYLDKRLF